MNKLENLRDIHLPQAVSFWPPAIGWWILLGLSVLLLIGCFLFWRYRYKPMRYQRQALKTLEHLQQSAMTDDQFADAIARLIRQTIIVRHPELASLQGDRWRDYLAGQMPEDIAADLAIGRYQPGFSVDREQLYQATRQWLRGLS